MQRPEAGVDDGVELLLRGEVLAPGLLGEAAALVAGGEVRLEEFGKAADVFLWNLEQEAAPVDASREQVLVRDEDGSDAGAHDLEQTDAACSCTSGAEDEVGGGESAGVMELAVFAAGLIEIPVVVGAGVFDKNVGAIKTEIEELFAKQRRAPALEGEEERLGGERMPSR